MRLLLRRRSSPWSSEAPRSAAASIVVSSKAAIGRFAPIHHHRHRRRPSRYRSYPEDSTRLWNSTIRICCCSDSSYTTFQSACWVGIGHMCWGDVLFRLADCITAYWIACGALCLHCVTALILTLAYLHRTAEVVCFRAIACMRCP